MISNYSNRLKVIELLLTFIGICHCVSQGKTTWVQLECKQKSCKCTMECKQKSFNAPKHCYLTHQFYHSTLNSERELRHTVREKLKSSHKQLAQNHLTLSLSVTFYLLIQYIFSSGSRAELSLATTYVLVAQPQANKLGVVSLPWQWYIRAKRGFSTQNYTCRVYKIARFDSVHIEEQVGGVCYYGNNRYTQIHCTVHLKLLDKKVRIMLANSLYTTQAQI